jgi:hypothetical protein
LKYRCEKAILSKLVPNKGLADIKFKEFGLAQRQKQKQNQNKEVPSQTSVDQRRSGAVTKALSHTQQCRNSRNSWTQSIVGCVQGTPAGTSQGSPEAEGYGAGKYPEALGACETQVGQKGAYVQKLNGKAGSTADTSAIQNLFYGKERKELCRSGLFGKR